MLKQKQGTLGLGNSLPRAHILQTLNRVRPHGDP